MEKDMSPEEALDLLKKYQENPYVHPLTCGTDSLHENLVPMIEAGRVVLKCLNCPYVQIVAPYLIQEAKHKEEMRILFETKIKDVKKKKE